MAEGVVESKEEMKKRMERIKKGEGQGETGKKLKETKEKTEEKLGETKEKTEEKLGETKEKLKETREKTEEKLGETKEKLKGTKEETKEKLGETKEKLGETKEKLGETKEKLGETKEKLGETKEKTEEKLGETEEKLKETREETRERWSDIKENLGDVKEETASQLEKYQRESEKEGKNPAEKFLSDIITGFLQKTEDVNQAMVERTGTLIPIPLTDVVETDDSIIIMVDIPGLTKEDIELGISQDSVEITATYEEKSLPANGKFIQKERGYGAVHRTINLSTPVNVKKASASYKNCILTITLPKKQKEMTKITIQE
ncbi:MAG: Hsp20 family protein [Methanobacteriaceae archaeon]|nr:Hsp20 family protein [Methanobacteriaceae archaeon]